MEELIFHTFSTFGNAQVNMKHIFLKLRYFFLSLPKVVGKLLEIGSELVHGNFVDIPS